jgi:hypothetical protein
MLSDYIEAYKEAIKNKDIKEQQRIEKAVRKLGMDKMTLLILAKEV